MPEDSEEIAALQQAITAATVAIKQAIVDDQTIDPLVLQRQQLIEQLIKLVTFPPTVKAIHDFLQALADDNVSIRKSLQDKMATINRQVKNIDHTKHYQLQDLIGY